jgi:anthranilate synthase component 1/para-aminobenzoate synthetase component 1
MSEKLRTTIYKKIPSDLVNFDVFIESFLDKKPFLFLDSGKGPEKIARFSLFGLYPEFLFTSKGNLIQIIDIKTDKKKVFWGNPILKLQQILDRNKILFNKNLPFFVGGGIGYFSYDIYPFFEKISSQAQDDMMLPDIFFVFVEGAVVVDHLKKEIIVVLSPELKKENTNEIEKETESKIDEILGLLRSSKTKRTYFFDLKKDISFSKRGLDFESNFTKKDFEQIVKIAKEYIKKGDIYQVNLSQRLVMEANVDSFEVYKVLKKINPSPFAFYFDFGEFQLISCSPERLIKINNGLIQTRPIAGTRPRGRDQIEDLRLRRELYLDEKERAEHIMLVDLERNDLGRICVFGTVEIDELMVLEEYSHVTHIVSNIKGILNEGIGLFDVLKACFPGGTITGTPKIRSIEIIDELEPVKRGPYTGSAGYLSYNGNIDLNIIIRTIIKTNQKFYAQAGAGVVADSNPEREYYETLYKAESLIQAIGTTRKRMRKKSYFSSDLF